jgi:hypothetical protein
VNLSHAYRSSSLFEDRGDGLENNPLTATPGTRRRFAVGLPLARKLGDIPAGAVRALHAARPNLSGVVEGRRIAAVAVELESHRAVIDM